MQFHDLTMGGLALTAVLGLIWLIHRLLRGTALVQPGATGRMRHVQSLSIDARRRMVLVECDGRVLVVLTGGQTDMVMELSAAAASLAGSRA